MIIFIVILVLLLWYVSKEPTFPGLTEIKRFIRDDIDGHIGSLNEKDLMDRRCNNRKEYKNIYLENIGEFSTSQKNILRSYSEEATKFLNSIKSPYINNKKMNSIPWKFAMTNNAIELGLPHTRGDIIFIPECKLNRTREKMIRTLIHEKIHIYQRMYPCLFINTLSKMGYKKLGKINNREILKNPDTDNSIYLHPDGTIMMPRTISNSIDRHPNEFIAYSIAQCYTG